MFLLTTIYWNNVLNKILRRSKVYIVKNCCLRKEFIDFAEFSPISRTKFAVKGAEERVLVLVVIPYF